MAYQCVQTNWEHTFHSANGKVGCSPIYDIHVHVDLRHIIWFYEYILFLLYIHVCIHHILYDYVSNSQRFGILEHTATQKLNLSRGKKSIKSCCLIWSLHYEGEKEHTCRPLRQRPHFVSLIMKGVGHAFCLFCMSLCCFLLPIVGKKNIGHMKTVKTYNI